MIESFMVVSVFITVCNEGTIEGHFRLYKLQFVKKIPQLFP